MKQYLTITYHSLRNHGVKLVTLRFLKFFIVKLKRLFQHDDSNNLAKWNSLKNKYNGQRVFIIGNGPSLNETPLYLLKNEYTLCFNHFNLMFDRIGWVPDFYMVTDDMVIRDAAEELNKNILPKVKYGFFPDLHPNNTNFKKYVNEADNVLWLKTDNPKFCLDLPNCGINNTVVNAGLQVMAFLGFKEIYLLGVDASYSFEAHKVKKINTRDLVSEEADPNHFDPRYFGKGKKYHYQPMYEMVEKFKVAKRFFSDIGVEIFNAGVRGKLEVFERKSLIEILNYSEEKIKKLFVESINKKLTDKDLEIFFASNEVCFIDESWNDLDIFFTEEDTGKKIINKALLTHVPFGPYKGKYLFINRNNKALEFYDVKEQYHKS
jgi:hypothetical protein